MTNPVYCLNPKCYSPDTIPKGTKWFCKKCGHLFILLHKFQLKALESAKRFILLNAGIQGGKSEVGAKWLRDEIKRYWHEEGDYLVAAPTYKTLWQSTLGKFLEEADLHRLGKFNKQDMIYLLKNGKRVFCRSTEDPNSLEAMTLRAIWLDEVGQMKRQVWINLQGRTAVLEGRIFMSTTPYPDYWWPVTEIIEPWKDGDKNYEIVEFDSIENPSFPKREYERAKKTMDSRVFAMRYEGKYVKMSGLVYPDFGTANIAECSDQSKIITWLAGMDFGHNFAFVLIGRDKDGTYWQVAEIYAQGGLLKEHAEAIKKLCQGKSLFGIYADPSEPGLMQELTVLGITPIIPGDNDVELGINRVGELIKAKRFKVSHSCPNTIDELETYHRRSKDDEMSEVKIVKVKDHAIDAVRYCLLSYPDEEMVIPVEKKDYEYSSVIERRREAGLKKIRERFRLKEEGVFVDADLGSDW